MDASRTSGSPHRGREDTRTNDSSPRSRSPDLKSPDLKSPDLKSPGLKSPTPNRPSGQKTPVAEDRATDPSATDPSAADPSAGVASAASVADPEIEDRIGLAGEESHRWWVLAASLLLLAGLGVALWFFLGGDAPPGYETQKARIGTLTLSVTATGALEAVTTVEVGSEISGLIETVAVEANDQVEQGQVLARLDTDRLEAEVIQARANVTAAEAAASEAEATLFEQEQKTRRAERLAEDGFISTEDLQAARAALARAREARSSAEAHIAVARASLEIAETTLRKAAIRAPISGVVLERSVDPGQAVAASFQTPVLFTIAEDLRRMELHVDVDEADVSRIRDGQSATFLVDAHPDRSFPATVTKVHYAPKTVSGVVTYRAVLAVDNADRALRPGMTATAEIQTDSLPDALLVPNSALRFTPPDAPLPAGDTPVVWQLRDGVPAPVPVSPGASDGQWTAVETDSLRAGAPVIVRIRRGDA